MDGGRIDVLLQDSQERPVVVECKQGGAQVEHIEQTRRYMELLKEAAPSGRVLDIGCGEGRITRLFGANGFDAVGIDYVSEALQRAVEGGGAPPAACKIAFLLGDALQWPFQNGSFHVAVDNGCFHHVATREWRRYLNGLLRVLRSRGFFLLTVFTREDGHAPRGDRSWAWHKGHYDHFFTLEELKGLFGKHFDFINVEESREGDHAFYHLLLRRVG